MAEEVVFSPVTVNGRELVFRNPNPIQVAMMHRLSKIMAATGVQLNEYDRQKISPKDERYRAAITVSMDTLAKLLDLFASLVADDVREWLTDEMIQGRIDDEALMKMFQEILPPDPESKPAVKPAPRARRTA